MNAIEVIENYTNGNLTDAKQAAKRFNWRILFVTCRDMGKPLPVCEAIADYLTGKGTFQAACDAEHKH